MNNLRLRTKLGLLVGLLAATTLIVAAVGYYQLGAVNDHLQRVVEVTSKEADLCAKVRLDLLLMRRMELDCIMSLEDGPSHEYAEKARQAGRDADQDFQKLATMFAQNPSAEDVLAQEDFKKNWDAYQQIQKQALDLGVQNSNYKAHLLLRGEVAAKLAAFEAAVEDLVKKLDDDAAAQANQAAALAAVVSRRRGAQQLLRQVLDLHAQFGGYVLTNEPKEMEALARQTAEVKEKGDAQLADLNTASDAKDKPLVDRIRGAFDQLTTQDAQLATSLAENTIARSGELELHKSVETINASLGALDRLDASLRTKLVADMTSARDSSTLAQRLMIGVPALGLLLSILLAVVLAQSITRPIGRAVELSEAIARGDLTRRLNLQQKDEVGRLTQALDQAAAAFSRTIGDIRGASDGVAASGTELTTVSHQLLAQSEEMSAQASHVAEGGAGASAAIDAMAAAAEQVSVNAASISSASEEISVNARAVSASAQATSENLAAAAAGVRQALAAFEQISREAREGSQVASQALAMSSQATGAMNALDRASGEINKVTDTIKMIAFWG